MLRGKRGKRVKRLTVCYHGNATPLRQEESLNPARYGPCRLSQYTPSTAFSPRKSKGRRMTRTAKGVQEKRREDERRVGGGWWRPDYVANSVFTPKCFHRALPIYGICRVNSTCSLSFFLSLLNEIIGPLLAKNIDPPLFSLAVLSFQPEISGRLSAK